jgi:glutathione S-transferase
LAEQSREVVEAYYKFLDRHLENHTYLAGEEFSIADIVALCTIDFAAKLNELPHSSEQAHLDRWHQSVSGRPSAKA